MSSNDRHSKHQALIKIIQTRKRQQLKEHPRGTRLNGTSANVPSSINNTNLRITKKKLRDRKSIANERKKENEKLKKQPLPMEEMEEFIGMKPVGKRNWSLDESQFLRFKSAQRHSVNSRSRPKGSPVKKLENLEHENEPGNNPSFFKRFVGRYEPSTSSVHSRPAPVRYGKGKGKGKGTGKGMGKGKRIVENI